MGRFSASGHFHRHQEETVNLWFGIHGSPESHHKTYVQVFLEDVVLWNIFKENLYIRLVMYVQVLLEDVVLGNISEQISLMENCKLWKSYTVCRHYDDVWRQSK